MMMLMSLLQMLPLLAKSLLAFFKLEVVSVLCLPTPSNKLLLKELYQPLAAFVDILLKETTAWLFLIQVVQQPPPPVFPELVQLSVLMSTTSDYQLEIIITPLTCSDEHQQSDILLLLLNISLEFLTLPNQ